MEKKKIIDKYKNTVIGDNYKDEKLFIDVVSTEDQLIDTMYDFLGREVDLHKEGIEFLQEYWGLEEVAEIIFKHENGKGDFVDTFKNENGLVKWLNDML